jgi:hypothetical protein
MQEEGSCHCQGLSQQEPEVQVSPVLSMTRISYLNAIIGILHGISRGIGIRVCTDPTLLPIRPSTLHLPSGVFLKSSISRHSSTMGLRTVISSRVSVC